MLKHHCTELQTVWSDEIYILQWIEYCDCSHNTAVLIQWWSSWNSLSLSLSLKWYMLMLATNSNMLLRRLESEFLQTQLIDPHRLLKTNFKTKTAEQILVWIFTVLQPITHSHWRCCNVFRTSFVSKPKPVCEVFWKPIMILEWPLVSWHHMHCLT